MIIGFVVLITALALMMTTGFSAFKALEGLGELAESAEAVEMV